MKTKLVLFCLGAALCLFGAYLIYDRSLLPIVNGITTERSGVTTRAHEPVMFWSSVVMYGSFGVMICGFGLWSLWNAFRTQRK